MIRRGLAVALLAMVAARAGAQKPERCVVELLRLGEGGTYQQQSLFGGNKIITLAPNAQLRCTNQPVQLWTDSLYDLNNQVFRLMGHARYLDPDYEVRADTLVYTLSIEQIQAVGHVVVTDRKSVV